MGGNAFCLKACDPKGAHAADFCQHVFDRIGCSYNAPSAAQDKEFTSCDGDNQDYPGVYTDPSGQVQTFVQPPESLGSISTMPYQPRVPASSNCVTYTSASIYAAAATDTAISSGPTSSGSPSGSPSGSLHPSGASSSKSGASGAKPTSTGTAAGDVGAASGLAVTSISSIFVVAFAVAFLA